MASATSDMGAVLDAIELGWSMAELRARYWMGHGPKRRSAPGDDSAKNFLPLGGERSQAELAIQTQSVVCGLATTLGLDLDLVRLSYQADATAKASEQLGWLIHQLELGGPDAWPRFSQSQQLLAKVRLTYDLDLAAEAATLCPANAVRKPDDRRRAPPITVETSMPEVEIYQAGGRNGNQSDKQDSPAAGRVGEVEGQPATR